MSFNLPFNINLEQLEDGTEATVTVTGTVNPDYDFVLLVDVTVVRDADPDTTEHYFAGQRYLAGTWPGSEVFNIAISPAVDIDAGDTVDATAFAAYNVNITTP